jgi:AbrB family looped-hinge helix DNA binding protein
MADCRASFGLFSLRLLLPESGPHFCEVTQMHRTSLSTRGQIVIPVQIRNKLGLKPGTKFTVYDLDGKLVLVPEFENPVEHGLGFFNRKETLETSRENSQ